MTFLPGVPGMSRISGWIGTRTGRDRPAESPRPSRVSASGPRRVPTGTPVVSRYPWPVPPGVSGVPAQVNGETPPGTPGDTPTSGPISGRHRGSRRDVPGTVPPGVPGDPRWLTWGLGVGMWACTAVATLMSATGQVDWAREHDVSDWRRYLAPAGIEAVMVCLLLLGARTARSRRSPLPYWCGAAAVGVVAIWTNWHHRGGPVFAAFSAAALILWLIKMRDDAARWQITEGARAGRPPAFERLWLIAPRTTARAWLISQRLQIADFAEAIRLAEVWLYTRDEMRALRYLRRVARRTAWSSTRDAAGCPPLHLPAWVQVAALAAYPAPDTAPPAAVDVQVPDTPAALFPAAPPPPPPAEGTGPIRGDLPDLGGVDVPARDREYVRRMLTHYGTDPSRWPEIFSKRDVEVGANIAGSQTKARIRDLMNQIREGMTAAPAA